MIPSRFSEHHFRLYEKLLGLVVAASPKAIEFPGPRHISTDTFANQIRDAVKSYRRYKWTTELFTYEQFESCWEITLVQVREFGMVRIGPRGAAPTAEAARSEARNIGLRTETTNIDKMRAILQLHHDGDLTEPTLFVGLALLTALRSTIDDNNLNVVMEILPNEEGILIF